MYTKHGKELVQKLIVKLTQLGTHLHHSCINSSGQDARGIGQFTLTRSKEKWTRWHLRFRSPARDTTFWLVEFTNDDFSGFSITDSCVAELVNSMSVGFVNTLMESLSTAHSLLENEEAAKRIQWNIGLEKELLLNYMKLFGEDAQLHSIDGPVGDLGYFYRGRIVPAYVIETPELITLAKIAGESDPDTRLAMIARYKTKKGEDKDGGPAYLKDSGATVIDYELGKDEERSLVVDERKCKWLICEDGSGKRYAVPVPDESLTCKEAHQFISGIPDELIISQS